MTVLACDMGGQRIKLGIVHNGEVVAGEVLPAHSDQTLASRLHAVAEALLNLCRQQELPPHICAGIGLSYPSIVDSAGMRILDEFGKFPDAPGFDLAAWARQSFGLPLALENDARMALIGEWRYGAGRGFHNLVMITLGTGLGTAAILEDRVLRGPHGQAGCLGGHLAVRHDGRTCSCGNRGCAEAEASTAVLPALARERTDFASSALAREPVLDYAAVFKHAARGDACAEALKAHSLAVWSALTVNLIHAYDPELLIFGGGIMASAEAILPAIREHVRRHAHTPWGEVKIAVSELGDQAALLACEWLVQEHLGNATEAAK